MSDFQYKADLSEYYGPMSGVYEISITNKPNHMVVNWVSYNGELIDVPNPRYVLWCHADIFSSNMVSHAQRTFPLATIIESCSLSEVATDATGCECEDCVIWE